MSERFDILIIDPDTQSRGQLKQAALCLPTFKKVFFAGNLEEALARTGSHENVDVVVMSNKFPFEEISGFIASAKGTPKGTEWAFVSLLKAADRTSKVVADSMMVGIDGFLLEPYSADNLKEMAELTNRVRLRNADSRKRGVLKMLLQEIRDHLDALAFYTSQGRAAPLARQKLADSCEQMKTLVGKDFNMAVYTELASEVFENAIPNQANAYRGVSSRVKAKLQAKQLKRLEDQYK